MIFGGVAMTLAHAVSKALVVEMPEGVLVLWRHVLAALCFAPLLLRDGVAAYRTSKPFGHFWRTVFGFAGFFAFTWSLARLTLGDTVALSFTAPFWSALLAVVLFGERVRHARLLATCVGFAGVLLIAKPGFGFQPAMLVALGGALVVSLAMAAVKQLTATESPESIAFYFFAIGSVLALPLALLDWRWPAPWEWGMLALLGVFSFFGQMGLTRGYLHGAFSKMAPMDFLRLPTSVIVGLVVFAELPDPWSLLGMLVIAGSALAILLVDAKPNAARA
jgi:drug/metabolite transporter (DMT)-like permease